MLNNFFSSRERKFPTPKAPIVMRDGTPELHSKITFYDHEHNDHNGTIAYVSQLDGEKKMHNLGHVHAYECDHYLLLSCNNTGFSLIRRPTGATKIMAIQTGDQIFVGFEETQNWAIIAAEMEGQLAILDHRRFAKFFNLNNCAPDDFEAVGADLKRKPKTTHGQRTNRRSPKRRH